MAGVKPQLFSFINHPQIGATLPNMLRKMYYIRVSAWWVNPPLTDASRICLVKICQTIYLAQRLLDNFQRFAKLSKQYRSDCCKTTQFCFASGKDKENFNINCLHPHWRAQDRQPNHHSYIVDLTSTTCSISTSPVHTLSDKTKAPERSTVLVLSCTEKHKTRKLNVTRIPRYWQAQHR